MFFFSSSNAQAARSTQLDNFQRFSQIVIDAAEKFFQLGNSLSEAILDDGNQSSTMVFSPLSSFENSTHLWLELSKHHLPSFITNYLHIASQAHEEMVKLAEEQIRLSQQLVVVSLDKAKASAPWEAESLLKAMKSSVNFSSDALAQVSEASIKAAELVEQQVEKAIKPARASSRAAA
jgi:hypothetical protein